MALLPPRTGSATWSDADTLGRTTAVTPGHPEVDTGASLAPAGGLRARASVVATIALMLGLTAALAVLTGVLAGAGIAIGMIATFLGVAGIVTTRRRHVTGRGDALLGISLGLGAVVIGILTFTHNLSWLSVTTNEVARAHDWLALYLPWLVPTN